MDLYSHIEKLAREEGFNFVGLTRLEKDSPGSRLFNEWLEKGYQGEMTYLERGADKRADPSRVLEGAKSIIVLGWDYGKKTEGEGVPQKSPFISRYAWGKDYHEILGEKRKKLEVKLAQAFPEARFKGYVDTGPVMEKYWGSLAGLGWVGKHTNVIHPQEGSYFFLTCLLTDLQLTPSFPSADHCGRCTACLDVCPTRAIVAPYVLDARLCISYLTIELKGPIPRELRAGVGTHIFGCDDCQEVCPWNRHARLPEEFLREAPVEELIGYLALTPQEFKKRFADSPVLRAKRRGFLRNVCVALGNRREVSTVPALIQALQDEEALIRGHAAWALGRFENESAKDALRRRYEVEPEAWVQEEIAFALIPFP
ncbi:MAG: tRNA epoxyqueuosine(34) reductase QueG [bacterium]